jgi:hypothetical protein
MKVFKILIASAMLVAVLAPDVALAKKKKRAPVVPRTLTEQQRIEGINWCRKKYPGPYTWNVEFGPYDGKKQWICRGSG